MITKELKSIIPSGLPDPDVMNTTPVDIEVSNDEDSKTSVADNGKQDLFEDIIEIVENNIDEPKSVSTSPTTTMDVTTTNDVTKQQSLSPAATLTTTPTTNYIAKPVSTSVTQTTDTTTSSQPLSDSDKMLLPKKVDTALNILKMDKKYDPSLENEIKCALTYFYSGKEPHKDLPPQLAPNDKEKSSILEVLLQALLHIIGPEAAEALFDFLMKDNKDMRVPLMVPRVEIQEDPLIAAKTATMSLPAQNQTTNYIAEPVSTSVTQTTDPVLTTSTTSTDNVTGPTSTLKPDDMTEEEENRHVAARRKERAAMKRGSKKTMTDVIQDSGSNVLVTPIRSSNAAEEPKKKLSPAAMAFMRNEVEKVKGNMNSPSTSMSTQQSPVPTATLSQIVRQITSIVAPKSASKREASNSKEDEATGKEILKVLLLQKKLK